MRTLNSNRLTETPKKTKIFTWNAKRRFRTLSTP